MKDIKRLTESLQGLNPGAWINLQHDGDNQFIVVAGLSPEDLMIPDGYRIVRSGAIWFITNKHQTNTGLYELTRVDFVSNERRYRLRELLDKLLNLL